MNLVDKLEQEGSFELFLTALRNANLLEVVRDGKAITIFAPTDEAFRKLSASELAVFTDPGQSEQLAKTLKLHLAASVVSSSELKKRSSLSTLTGRTLSVGLKGDEVRVDLAGVVRPDLKVSNGVIHVIDRVLLLPEGETTDVLAAKGFATMKRLIDAAGMAEQANGDWPLTVLAPTDAAFAKLPSGQIDQLLRADQRAKLQEFVNRHIVVGRTYADCLGGQGTLHTLAGNELTIRRHESAILLSGCSVSRPDIASNNAVIHGVDCVLAEPRQ